MEYKNLLTLLLVALGALPAGADLIMRVNVDNPAAITFMPTAAFSQNTFLDVDSSANGIALRSFFTGNTATTPATPPFLDSGSIDVFDSSSLTTRQDLNKIFIDSFSGWTPNDIAFFTDNASLFTMSFGTSATALAGSATHDLSGFAGHPSVGTTGDVFVGDPSNNRIIGQWEAVTVPEPSGAVLSVVLLLGIGGRKRKK